MTLTASSARLIRASFDVSEGRCYRCPERYIARNVADTAHSNTGRPVRVYLDSFGFIVTANTVTRDDVTLVYTACAS